MSTDTDTELERLVDEIIVAAGIDQNADLIHHILVDGIRIGRDRADRLDLKIASSALGEMRQAFRMFARFRGRDKVTVFGSARTRPDDVLYRMAREVARRLAAHDWMVVTGAGPGIMQAATEGAGPDHSIGVSIRLPFESLNPAFDDADGGSLVQMKYFFTRKLMLVKESKGFVVIPGGFGTFDELFELLTLQQTGKAVPVPIVLLDRPAGPTAQDAPAAPTAAAAAEGTNAEPGEERWNGGEHPHPGTGYWAGMRRFAEEQLVPASLIAADDLDRVLITDDVDRAVEEILGFWRDYDSLRWVGPRLVLRLRHAPTDAELADLQERFGRLSPDLPIQRTAPLRPEIRDDDRVELPRILLQPAPQQIGRLHQLIRAINALPSAGR